MTLKLYFQQRHNTLNLPFYLQDVDECLSKEDYCSKHAVCSNLLGSFSCQCNDGFKGNGFECEGKPSFVWQVIFCSLVWHG